MKINWTFVAAFLFCTWATGGFSQADTVYSIEPYSLSNGYEIVGGSITTDGTTGRGQSEFQASNIVDYEVIVTGPINLTFSPSNRNASIFAIDPGLMVTDTGIWIEASDDASHDLRFGANELGINALNIQQVFWGHGPIGNDATTVGFVAGAGTDQGTFRQTPRIGRLLIAGSLSAIPEPGSATCLVAFGLIAIARRRRSSKIQN